MTLSPADIAQAQSLLSKRKDLENELFKVSYHTDVAVGGRYQGGYLNEAEMDIVQGVMRGFFTRLIAEVDAQLLKIGVAVKEPE